MKLSFPGQWCDIMESQSISQVERKSLILGSLLTYAYKKINYKEIQSLLKWGVV